MPLKKSSSLEHYWRPHRRLVEGPQILVGDLHIFIGYPQVFIGDPHIFVGDPNIFLGDCHIFIEDPKIFIGDPIFLVETPARIWGSPTKILGIQRKYGVSNENLGSPKKIWLFQMKICGSPTRHPWGSPIVLQWWWFFPDSSFLYFVSFEPWNCLCIITKRDIQNWVYIVVIWEEC